MNTLSPLLADAFGLLQTDLYRHLDDVDFLACKFAAWTDEDIDTARKLLPDLVLVIRGLLVEHQIQAAADCRICGSAWPCPVVTEIHGLLKDPKGQFVALVTRMNEARC